MANVEPTFLAASRWSNKKPGKSTHHRPGIKAFLNHLHITSASFLIETLKHGNSCWSNDSHRRWFVRNRVRCRQALPLSPASCVIIASSNKSKVDSAVSRLILETSEVIPGVSGKVNGEVVDAKQAKEVQALMERIGEIDHWYGRAESSTTVEGPPFQMLTLKISKVISVRSDVLPGLKVPVTTRTAFFSCLVWGYDYSDAIRRTECQLHSNLRMSTFLFSQSPVASCSWNPASSVLL